MAKKFYAVRTGRQTGIFTSWDDCRRQVTGFAGASFKGFETREEAEAFLSGDSLMQASPVASEAMFSPQNIPQDQACLLYTSDAADEL